MHRSEGPENDTDYKILENNFGNEYFILKRIKIHKTILSSQQKEELNKLVHERDHFDILRFVNKLRK